MKDEDAEAEKQCQLYDHQHETAARERQQEIAAAHGRGHIALQQFALAIIYESKAHAPHARIHQVHAEQAGN